MSGKVARRRFLLAGLVSTGLGFLLSTAMLAAVLIDTAGTHPKGICEFVENRHGLLPLNPKGADMGEVSCNPNIALAAFYIGLPGFVFSVFVGAVLGLVFGLFRYFKKKPDFG